MHEAESTKYLGDILHQSGKAKYNIKERQIKAYAIKAEIRAILEEVPLGKYRTEIGLQLRQAMFVNGVLFNSEVWPKLTVADITMLETVDHHLITFYDQALTFASYYEQGFENYPIFVNMIYTTLGLFLVHTLPLAVGSSDFDP